MPAWPREPSSNVLFDLPTLREVVRRIDQRLAQLDTYGAGGCPTCHDAELRALLARVREMASTPR